MPAYNAAPFIQESIESIIQQSYSNWELIIVDDGSTDNTAEIINKYIQKDNRIFYYHQENGRQAKARNLAIKYSKGEYLAFLDSDDMWTKERLETGIRILLDRQEIALVFSQGYYLGGKKGLNYDAMVKAEWNIESIPLFLKKNRIAVLSVLVRKRAVDTIGGFNENPLIQNSEDYDLWVRLLFAGYKFCSIPQRLFYYRVHAEQSTFDDHQINLSSLNLYIDLLQKYPEHVYTGELIARIANFLPFDTFRIKVKATLSEYLKKKSLFRAGVYKGLNRLPLPNRYKDQFLLKMII